MFLTNIKRILKAGFVGFWRNGFVSLAAVLIMVVTLFTIGSVIFLGVLLNSSLIELQNKVDVNVYFVTSALEEDVLSVQSSLEALPEVASVEYVSREDALLKFRERHQGDELTLQALDELDENPLGAVLNVRAQDTSQYETIATFLEGGNVQSNLIDRVNFNQNRVAIEKLTEIIDGAERLGLAISIVLIVLSLIITVNTIRLVIYTARKEISVMRLVGAGNGYVRGPFVIEGMLYGLISGIIVLVLYYPLTLWLGPITERFFGSINIFEYYIGNFGQLFLIIMGSGIVLGALSSYLAVRRYLKV